MKSHLFFLCCLWFDVISKKSLPEWTSQSSILMFSSEFYSFSFSLVIDLFWVNFCVRWEKVAQLRSLAWKAICANIIVKKKCSFFIELYWHPFWKYIDHKCEGLFLDCQLSVDLHVYPMPVSYSLDFSNFVVVFEIRKRKSFSFLLLHCFDLIPFLRRRKVFCISTWILGTASQIKKAAWIFIGIGLNLEINLGVLLSSC